MNFGQSFKLALKSLRTSKMRAFLTMLGIIIGVGAVIVILDEINSYEDSPSELIFDRDPVSRQRHDQPDERPV